MSKPTPVFKAGDYVTRINCSASNVKKGRTYRVTRIWDLKDTMSVDGGGLRGYNICNFCLATQAEIEALKPNDTATAIKDTNPKDAIAGTKLPLNFVPPALHANAALAYYEGALKYGSGNWRSAGVRSSVYYGAAQRHLTKWFNGEECDPETNVPHLASVAACIGIILDAQECDKLVDDRPLPSKNYSKNISKLEEVMKHLATLHKDKKPHHHTRLDLPQHV